MELQEILGCLGNVDKLKALPLSTLKAAAKKYPFVSQLKILLAKKEGNPSTMKEHLISAPDHAPSLELLSELGLEETDPSLLIRVVKKESSKAKKIEAPVISLKGVETNEKSANLTLVKKNVPVKPQSQKINSDSNTSTKSKIKSEVTKETTPLVPVVKKTAEKIKVPVKSKSTTKPKPSTSKTTIKKNRNSYTPKRNRRISAVKSNAPKRTYHKRKPNAQKIKVEAINPPLPSWKDILSNVKLKKSPIVKSNVVTKKTSLPKGKSSRSKVRTNRSTKASVVKVKTAATKTLTKSKKTLNSEKLKASAKKKKQKKDITTLALSQTKKKTKSTNNSKKSKKTKKKVDLKKTGPIGSKKERLKFSEWLLEKGKKPSETGTKKSAKPKKKNKLKQRVKSSVVKKDEIATVTLAKLYSKQGHFKKAIKVYERLSLLNPQKSSFFAAKIRKLNQK